MYFRVDMNQTIASGHVMRCLAIADAFREINEESTFILADDEAKALIESKGHQTLILNSKWEQKESELEILRTLIQKEEIKELFVDSYQVTEKYLKELKQHVSLIYLDDLDKMTYPVDMLFCYTRYRNLNAYIKKYEDTETKLYLGTKYTPLRKEFWNTNSRPIVQRRQKKILVTTGGMDSLNVAEQIAKVVSKDIKNEYLIICGKQNKNYNQLLELEKVYSNIRILYDVQNMEELMSEVDCAISATGTTVFELCATKVPSICYVIADNQLELASYMHEEGVMIYAGDFRIDKEGVLNSIQRDLKILLSDDAKRKQMVEKMTNLMSGIGAMNIVREIRNIYPKEVL